MKSCSGVLRCPGHHLATVRDFDHATGTRFPGHCPSPVSAPVRWCPFVCLAYTNTGGEDGVSIYHYRRDGVMGAGTWFLTDRSRYSANYYIYDENGRMVKKYREFSDGLVSTQRFEHDEAGRVTKESLSARTTSVAMPILYGMNPVAC